MTSTRLAVAARVLREGEFMGFLRPLTTISRSETGEGGSSSLEVSTALSRSSGISTSRWVSA
jgi:hypothetical protein